MEYRDDHTDEIIRRAIGDGTNLSNAGKRLDLDDPYTPDDLKIVYKILKDNDFVPSWISESKSLDDAREALVKRIAKAIAANQRPETLNADIAAFNKQVLSFNLKAPQGVLHKRAVDFERERRRLTSG